MNGREMVWLVARREITGRIRERGFLVSSAITVLIVLAVVIVPGFLNKDHKSFDVALVGTQAARLEPVLGPIGKPHDVEVSSHGYADAGAARAAVRDGDVDAAVINDEVVSDGSLDAKLSQVLQDAHRAVLTEDRLREEGLDPQKVATALQVPLLRESTLSGDSEGDSARQGIAFIGTVLLFGQLIGYGTWVAFGVVEEKSSRVVELLLAAIRPWQLLAGKILGIGVLALSQLLVVSGAGLGAALAIGSVELPSDAYGIVASVLGWFVLGYAFFAAAYAAAASLVSRQEELSNVTSPMTMILVAGYVMGIFVTSSPNGGLAKVVSMIPPFSAMTMPARAAGGAVPGWQIALAVLLMVVATVGLIRLSGRIYAGAILRTGAKVRLLDAFRSAPAAAAAVPTGVGAGSGGTQMGGPANAG